MKKLFTFLFLLILLPVYAGTVTTYALTLTGTVKYAPDFKHFDYANPSAPKGGTFRRALTGTYDSFNSFAVKGVAFRASGYMYDTLLTPSGDEPMTYYGLLAESIEYPEDFSWVIFNLRKNARWHDGKPITARDVAFSFNKIKEVNPITRDYYRLVSKTTVLSEYKIKFHFETPNKELPLIVGQLTVIPEHYWLGRDLSVASLEVPLGSGPYKISSFEQGKTVTFERVKDYWGATLPVNLGFYNFDKLVFEYFRDQTVMFEAFKAGHFDITAEASGVRWYRGYTGKHFNSGAIIKEELPDRRTKGMTGIALNSAVEPLDKLAVRKALSYAYDFEWINKNLYLGGETRHNSYFSNSELASAGTPSAQASKIIKEVKPDAVAELLPFSLPVSDGSGSNRENLKTAVKLFETAGYTLKNGKMTDEKGRQLKLEITTSSKALEGELLAFQKALSRIGVDFYIRFLDSAQYVEKVRNKEYMMIYTAVKQSASPGNEQKTMWHSSAAMERGSRNYASIKDEGVDKLVELINTAPERETLIACANALDRLLLNGWYFIPAGYTDKYRIAYWNKFSKPSKSPEYTLGFDTWYIAYEVSSK